MKRYTQGFSGQPIPSTTSISGRGSVVHAKISEVVHPQNIRQSLHSIHIPTTHTGSPSVHHGFINNAIRHPTLVQHQRVEPIVYGPQIIPPLKTNTFHGVYTTPTLAVLSDKQIPVVGGYVSNEPKLAAYIQDINPSHVQQPISTKVIQATLKDVLSPQVIKITSQTARQYQPRGSQIGAFDIAPSIQNIRSQGSIEPKSTKILGENIKVSVYRSPDVIVKERQVITDGPKLQKQHVLRVGVEGRVVPTYRPHTHHHHQVEIRDLKLNKQQTVIVHEPRYAPQLVQPQKHTIQNVYEIKPTITSVNLPTIPANSIPHIQPVNRLLQSYQRETLETFQNNQIYRRANINPIVHQTNIQTIENTKFTNSGLISYDNNFIQIKNPTPIKDLSLNAGRFDDSINQSFNPNYTLDNIDQSIQRHTNSVYYNGDLSIGGGYRRTQEQHVGNQVEGHNFSSKLPQGKITQPLSFTHGNFQAPSVRPHIDVIPAEVERQAGNYQGPPTRANDPERRLLD